MEIELRDPELAEAVRALRRRRGGGAELLAWRDGREWRDVRSQDVNGYIQGVVGADATAKDFRTWHANVLATAELAADLGVTGTVRGRLLVELLSA